MCAWRSTSKPRGCSTEPTTARRGSSFCARSRARDSPSRSCARRPLTTGWRCSRWSACSPARGSSTRRRSSAEETGLEPAFLDEAARALGVPVREPGERAITEEELELSYSAKALLDAGLAPEAFLELTAVMSRSMANIAASFTSVFGEALLQAGDTERDLGLRYAEALRNLGPLAAPTLEQMFNLRHARADARGRDQPGGAPDRPARRQPADHRRIRRHRRLHAARRGRRAGGARAGGARLRAHGGRGRGARRCGS